jgi:hypothetical protein
MQEFILTGPNARIEAVFAHVFANGGYGLNPSQAMAMTKAILAHEGGRDALAQAFSPESQVQKILARASSRTDRFRNPIGNTPIGMLLANPLQVSDKLFAALRPYGFNELLEAHRRSHEQEPSEPLPPIEPGPGEGGAGGNEELLGRLNALEEQLRHLLERPAGGGGGGGPNSAKATGNVVNIRGGGGGRNAKQLLLLQRRVMAAIQARKQDDVQRHNEVAKALQSILGQIEQLRISGGINAGTMAEIRKLLLELNGQTTRKRQQPVTTAPLATPEDIIAMMWRGAGNHPRGAMGKTTAASNVNLEFGEASGRELIMQLLGHVQHFTQTAGLQGDENHEYLLAILGAAHESKTFNEFFGRYAYDYLKRRNLLSEGRFKGNGGDLPEHMRAAIAYIWESKPFTERSEGILPRQVGIDNLHADGARLATENAKARGAVLSRTHAEHVKRALALWTAVKTLHHYNPSKTHDNLPLLAAVARGNKYMRLVGGS